MASPPSARTYPSWFASRGGSIWPSALTSNGENGAAVLPECAEAGLDRINLSVFGTTPDELAAVQAPRLASPRLAARKLDALTDTIETACT